MTMAYPPLADIEILRAVDEDGTRPASVVYRVSDAMFVEFAISVVSERIERDYPGRDWRISRIQTRPQECFDIAFVDDPDEPDRGVLSIDEI